MPTEKEWFSWATGFMLPSGLYIGKRFQGDGTTLFSVHDAPESPFVWTKEKQWEWEPLPSSRDEAFKRRARYQTLEEAWEAAEGARTKETEGVKT